MGSLPEIRHKTAVSTIRSTTDRSIRERPRQRIDEARKKPTQRKDVTRGEPASFSHIRILLIYLDGLVIVPCGTQK